MKRGGGISGAVSLVMIFCVLCLAVFAALTLSTSNRDWKLAEQTAQSAAEYYEADRLAVAWAAGLPDGTAAASFPVGENQSLEVEVRKEGNTYQILRWQTVYTGDWEPDTNIIVWDGN